jgi:hypothetical protein
LIHQRQLLNQLGILSLEKPTTMYVDNQSAIALSLNPVFHSRTKHFTMRHHYVREQVAKGNVTLKYCSTDEMIADFLTKALARPKFEKFRLMAGVQHLHTKGLDL